jgi:DNA-binding FadR family transcriptional regulator
MEARLDAGTDSWEPDWGFHAAVTAAGQNPVVVAIVDLLGQRMTGELWQLMRERNLASSPSRPRSYLEDHRAIYLAIERRDSREATARMRLHLETIARDLADSDGESMVTAMQALTADAD